MYGIGSMDQGKNVVQVANFNIGKSCGSRFVMDSKDSFWNTMFEKELPKCKDWLDTIFLHHPLDTSNVNTTSSHVFKLLQNCPINITYVIDPKSPSNLGKLNVRDKV